MNTSREPLLKRLPVLFEIPEPDPDRARRRIRLTERTVMLSVRIFFVIMIYHSFSYGPWMVLVSNALDVTVEMVQLIFGVYILLSAVLVVPLFAINSLPLAVVQWTVYTSALVDGLLLSAMTLITGGMDSILYWLYLGLVLRNAACLPPGVSQLILNFLTSLFYISVALLDVTIYANLDETTARVLDIIPHDTVSEPIVLRVLVLWLTAISCYGVQAFLERQRISEEEAREFAARENQLHSAGRLAAEFAHQIKNPLAVIRNAAFSLERSFQRTGQAGSQQVEIIREEVARADRVITQIMGYAQLSEGRVEKLDVPDQINRLVEQVFPAAVPSGITVRKMFADHFPPLLMQRGHLSEILLNLLQNAREVLGDRGNVIVTANHLRDHSIEIAISDDGPGIPPDKLERIFEAYFTTKETGTGLGLAIVKHNVELYGGTIRVDSALGKGAKFTVTFPAKAMPKPFVK